MQGRNVDCSGLVTRFVHLDLLRGLAALLVLAGHLRSYVFQSFPELVSPGLLAKAFYLATGLAHQAVIIFFVLSGFLVGGRALAAFASGRFSWPQYLLRRVTRLWIVIVPALSMTLVLDLIGLHLTDGVGYDGRYYDAFSSGPRPPNAIDHSPLALLGNMAFLQTIYVHPFGSNGPLWSLANEFWYYIIFPLAVWVACGRTRIVDRVLGGSALVVIVSQLPAALLIAGTLWVAGVVAAWSTDRAWVQAAQRLSVARILAAVAVTGALILSRVWPHTCDDYVLGVVVACALPFLAIRSRPEGTYATVVRAASEVSYTLYLTHFPLLTLIAMTLFAPMRLEPGFAAASLFVGLLLAAIAWTALFWWLFERHTDRVFAMISQRWLSPAADVAGQGSA